MIVCPNCKHKEITGAVFCSQCGTQLVFSGNLTTHKIKTAQATEVPKRVTTPYRPQPPTTLDSWVTLFIIESGQLLPLTEREEFTLGRVSEGQPIMPDVDLTPYNAYADGVSRLHAVLKKIKNRVVIMDLGSSNGTYVNGSRIKSRQESPLAHGDIVSLGKLKIQVLLSQSD